MKININYRLSSETTQEVCKINQQICKLTNSEINFSDGTCRPHITLVSGEINPKDYQKILSIVKNFSSVATGKTTSFFAPHISGSYILCDTAEQEIFKTDCNNLLFVLQGIVATGKFLISNGNAAHITLGWAKDAQNAQDCLQSLQLPPTEVGELNVALAGPHGTVLEQTTQK